VSERTVYVGGDLPGRGVVAIDAETGRLRLWNPRVDDEVRSIAVAGRTVYLAGGFRSVGGNARPGLAAVHSVTGRTRPWNPRPDNIVRAVAFSGTTLYAGGDFEHIAGRARLALAAFSTRTGALTGWNPRARYLPQPDYGGVAERGIHIMGRVVYLGGTFDHVGGKPRKKVAAVDARTGSVLPWNPQIPSAGLLSAIRASGSTVFVAEFFDTPENHVPNLLAFALA
jgi:outer membrane protein assembly factor BamB